MTDHFDDPAIPDAELDALSELLSNPSIWADTDGNAAGADTEDAIVAAIAAEAAMFTTESVDPVEAQPVGEDTATGDDTATAAPVVALHSRRRRFGSFAAGAAAAALVLVGSLALFNQDPFGDDDGPSGVELALAGTELAPGATGTATIADTPLGTRIVLNVADLPPAEPGTYYEAWLRVDGQIGVSAGTFHLRGGDGEIELWAGVPLDDYPLFTITVQDEAQAESSGVVVLKGRIDQATD
jgi:hypothetical protein